MILDRNHSKMIKFKAKTRKFQNICTLTVLIFNFSTGKDLQETEKRLAYSPNELKCVNLPTPKFVLSVDTKNTCMGLHSGQNCTEDSLEIMARSPMHSNLLRWGWNKKTASYGPCRSSCDPAITGTVGEKGARLRIYNRKDFKGGYLDIRVRGCELIPLEYTRQLLSVKTFGKCFQLYNNVTCNSNGTGADSIELRRGTPLHNDLYFWYLREAKAVSHCSYKCQEKRAPPETETPLDDEMFLFSEKYYKGHKQKLVLKEGSCQDLSRHWQGIPISVKIFNQSGICFVLYERLNCESEEGVEGHRSLRIIESVEDLSAFKFGGLTRSVKKCSRK